jgi:hypothetical protein
MKKRTVKVGDVFGRWTVISLQTVRRWYALCECKCGSTREVNKTTLSDGRSTSCGCIRREKLSAQEYRHGYSGSDKTYVAWANMKARCGNPNHPGFELYGARGITVCEEWLAFERFMADMGEAPPGTTLERIDTNSGYRKSNCIWTEHKVNCQNTRSSKRWYLDGQAFASASDAAKALRVSRSTIYYRCLGRHHRGTFFPPQPGCWAEPVYQN